MSKWVKALLKNNMKSYFNETFWPAIVLGCLLNAGYILSSVVTEGKNDVTTTEFVLLYFLFLIPMTIQHLYHVWRGRRTPPLLLLPKEYTAEDAHRVVTEFMENKKRAIRESDEFQEGVKVIINSITLEASNGNHSVDIPNFSSKSFEFNNEIKKIIEEKGFTIDYHFHSAIRITWY